VEQWEERRELPCESLRGPLKLPSCPARATVDGDRVVFEGRGAGHGEGLDLEWAKRSGLAAEGILSRAYPRSFRARTEPSSR
jgi:peptidoglycan hydrolase-like amidase